MNTPLHVLIVEDRPDIADLLLSELKRAGFAPTARVVDNPAEYLFALAEQPQVILAGADRGGITPPDALDLLREQGYEIPVIVVSPAADEGAGIDCLRRGAADHLCEDRLARLGPAIERALAQRRMTAERRRVERVARLHERRFRATFDNAPVGMALTTAHGYVIDANPALCRLTGFSVEEIRAGGLSELVVAQDRPLVETADPGRPWRTAAGLDRSPVEGADPGRSPVEGADPGRWPVEGADPGRSPVEGAEPSPPAVPAQRVPDSDPEIRLLRAGAEPVAVGYRAAPVDDGLDNGGSGTGWHIIHQFVARERVVIGAGTPAAAPTPTVSPATVPAAIAGAGLAGGTLDLTLPV